MSCCLLIETVEAVENIEEIVRVPGMDLVVVAQFDLSTALGAPGRFDAPDFVEAVSVIERAVRDRGMPVGGAALTPEQTSSLITKGYRVLFHGFDVLMLKTRSGTSKPGLDADARNERRAGASRGRVAEILTTSGNPPTVSGGRAAAYFTA